MDTVIRMEGLGKIFRKTIGQSFTALDGLSLEIKQGEVFGFLGPNGAGKTTTIKILMNLIFATSGNAWILDKLCTDPASRRHIGYLPETSNLFDYLTFEEVLNFAGRCHGMDRKTIKSKVDELAEVLDMVRAKKTRLRKFSKGMLQRAGLAYALMGDPEVLILDEPMSGLDPIGRKDFVYLIKRLRGQGKTIFFSSHVLSDIETLCDRVGILVKGELKKMGQVSELLHEQSDSFVLRASGLDEQGWQRLQDLGISSNTTRDQFSIPKNKLENALEVLRTGKASIVSIDTKRRTLEDIFTEVVKLSSN